MARHGATAKYLIVAEFIGGDIPSRRLTVSLYEQLDLVHASAASGLSSLDAYRSAHTPLNHHRRHGRQRQHSSNIYTPTRRYGRPSQHSPNIYAPTSRQPSH